MAGKALPTRAVDIRKLARDLVHHLRKNCRDTHTPTEWTTNNFDALRSFSGHGYDLQHFPPDASSNQKGAFLWDYIAYQQGTGILVAAESEHNSKDTRGLEHDFEKLFYVQAPIKLFLFYEENRSLIEGHMQNLKAYMKRCCSMFAPGDIFVLYCRTGSSDDRVYWLQIPGDPPRFCNPGNFQPEDRFPL